MNDRRMLSQRLHQLRRAFNARMCQLRDKGPLAIVRDVGTKVQRAFGRTALPHTEAADDFDATYGTDTAGIIQPWNLDIPDSLVGQAVQYGTAGCSGFTALLASLNIAHQNYVFIDLGSGKGRALLLASRFPFKQILGVELSSQLHQVALLNITRFRADWQQCARVMTVCENATAFKFPAENIVLYLYNPFGAETLRTVVTNMESSLRVLPRRVYVIYVKPAHRKVFDESEDFSLMRSMQSDLIYANSMPEFIRA